MSLVRWKPFRDIMRRDFGWDPFEEGMLRRFFDEEDTRTCDWSPAVDILEKDKEIIIKAEIPGVEKKDIDISVQKNTLVIKGEKKYEEERKEQNYHRVERCYGTFQRSFVLPEYVEAEKIKATFKDGVLTLTLPKKPEVLPKSIDIKVE